MEKELEEKRNLERQLVKDMKLGIGEITRIAKEMAESAIKATETYRDAETLVKDCRWEFPGNLSIAIFEEVRQNIRDSAMEQPSKKCDCDEGK